MKHQALFSSKDKSKNIKVSSAATLLGPLRVNTTPKQQPTKFKYANFQNLFCPSYIILII